MKLKIKMFRNRETRQALENFRGKGARATNLATRELAEMIHEIVVESIRGGTKSGRIYKRYNPARIHQASAPGQAPADDLGNLAASYTILYQKVNQYVFSATVGSTAIYSARLEFGDARILPRPHLEPAVNEVALIAGGPLVDAWSRS